MAEDERPDPAQLNLFRQDLEESRSVFEAEFESENGRIVPKGEGALPPGGHLARADWAAAQSMERISPFLKKIEVQTEYPDLNRKANILFQLMKDSYGETPFSINEFFKLINQSSKIIHPVIERIIVELEKKGYLQKIETPKKIKYQVSPKYLNENRP